MMPFDSYPALAAELIRDHGERALALVQAEVRNATIDCDAERAAFWRLVAARVSTATEPLARSIYAVKV